MAVANSNRDGFTARVVVEPDTGLVTEARLTKAAGPDNSDATVGADLVGQDPTVEGQTDEAGPVQGLADSGTQALADPAGRAWAGSPSRGCPTTRAPAR